MVRQKDKCIEDIFFYSIGARSYQGLLASLLGARTLFVRLEAEKSAPVSDFPNVVV